MYASSQRSLLDDYDEMKSENKKFLDDSKNEYKCIIHHIKENTLQQIKDELDNISEEKFFKDIQEIQVMLRNLIVRGIVDQRLDKKYVLSINGKELLSMIPDPFEKK
jgi:hypothetical protein